MVKYSPAGRDYPQDQIARLIPMIEEEIGYECLGETLYEWLLANLNEYPADAAEWCEGSHYSEGDKVIRCGLLYESLEDLNTTDPIGEESEWQEALRFGENDCANYLWENYLRGLLALNIYIRSLNPTTRTTGANGLTILAGSGAYDGQGFVTAKKDELSDYKAQLFVDANTIRRNMERWAMKRMAKAPVCEVPLNTMPGCQKGLCAPDSGSRRRWGFKH